MRHLFPILILALAGCSSAKKAIGSSAQAINARSASSFQSAVDIHAAAQMATERRSVQEDQIALEAQERIIGLAGVIQDDQAYIQESSIVIQDKLHMVEDLTPWWASMMGNLAVAAIVIGVVILLWQTGIGMIIKKVLWSMGWFIPKATMRSAQVDMKALDRGHEMSVREAIAVRRSSDPAYEAARNKLNKEK